jgi:hypothetical protein
MNQKSIVPDLWYTTTGLQCELSASLRQQIFLIFFHLGVDRVWGHFSKIPMHF